jgi:outer membrane protein TolC
MPGFVMSLPGPGKLRAGGDIASAESQSRYFAFQTKILESAFEVKRTYFQLHFFEEKIRVERETLRLLADLESLARAQNDVGKVTLQDVIRAQIEEDRLDTEFKNLEDSRGSLVAQFKAALGLQAGDAAPPVPQRFESTPLELTPESLFQMVLSNNTRLKGMEAEVRGAEAAIALANKARVPDSSLGLMADLKTSPVLYRPVATVSLPIWRDKIAAQIAEAQANKRAAEARLSAEQINLAVSVAEKSYVYREASRTAELLRDQLLPKARRSLEVARSGYLGGQIDFFNLIDTERTLLGFQLDEVEARTQRELALAEISLLSQGMPPTSVNMGASVTASGPNSGATSRRAAPAGMNTMR